MANKYIRHGETYCGDGTTSAAATSNGGVGAWNNINVFEGSTPAYGVLAAGDTVYIRSKDQAGAEITRTITANTSLGNSAATVSSVITWVIDNGVVWPGVSGILRYPNSGGNVTVTIVDYNHVVVLNKDGLVVATANVWGSAWTAFLFGRGVYAKNLKVDGSAWTQYSEARVVLGGAIVENFSIYIGTLGPSGALITGVDYIDGDNTLINPEIVIGGSGVGQSVFAASTYSGACCINVIGGSISGAAIDAGAYLFGTCTSKIRIYGTLIPRSARLSLNPSSPNHYAEVVGCDGDGTGGYLDAYWGWATSRTDNYPPTLSATLPSSDSTAWAWRVYPRNASWFCPMRMVFGKLFTETSSIKTIALEFLVATSFAVTKNDFWIDICYVDDATGLAKHINTRDVSQNSLDASSANWTATTWGMTNFNKRKLFLATPTSIKQNTMVVVTVFCARKSTTSDDILFIDPDFGVV